MLLQTIYNLYLHPLRSFPGPRRYAVSRMPWVCKVLGGQAASEVARLHRRYGEVVRVAPDELIFQSSQAWSDIYGQKKAGTPENQKDPVFYFSGDLGCKDIITGDTVSHRRFRRILSRGFSGTMHDQASLIQGYVKLLVKQLHAKGQGGQKAQDMTSWYNWTTFDIIGDLTFGEPFGCLKNGEYHPWVALIFDSVKAAYFLRNTRYFPRLASAISCLIPKRLREKRLEHLQLIKEKVSQRLAMSMKRPDFMDAILNPIKGLVSDGTPYLFETMTD